MEPAGERTTSRDLTFEFRGRRVGRRSAAVTQPSASLNRMKRPVAWPCGSGSAEEPQAVSRRWSNARSPTSGSRSPAPRSGRECRPEPLSMVPGRMNVLASLSADDSAIVVLIVAARLLIPYAPLMILVAFTLDAVDGTLLERLTAVDTGPGAPTRAGTRRSTSTTCRSPTYRRCATGPIGERSGSPVPLLLQARRDRGVRDDRSAHAAADLPEHLRVLLHRLRARADALIITLCDRLSGAKKLPVAALA